MLRLLILLLCVGATLAMLLQLREQQQAMRAQNLKLHRQIRTLERTLWQQQVLIGADLAPGSLERQITPTPIPDPVEPVALPPVSRSAWDGLFAPEQ